MFSERKKRMKYLENAFGTNPVESFSFYNASSRMDRVSRFHKELVEQGENQNMVDDITWNDLEMDQVFLRLNHTNSFIGEQVLYHKLHTLSMGENETEEAEFEKKMLFYEQNPKERTVLEERLFRIGKREEGYFLYEFLSNTGLWEIGKTWLFHLLQILLIASIACSIIFDMPGLLTVTGVLVFINLMIYMYSKQKYDAYFTSLIDFKRVYDCAAWMLKRQDENCAKNDEVKASVKKLNRMSHVILTLDGRRQASVTGDAIAMLNEYIWGILLIDLSLFNHIMRIIRNKEDDVLRILSYVGETDAEIAIASYRKSEDCWCVPEFVDNGYIVQDLIHPLLNNPVGNNWQLPGKAIITGTNASGKSTFMKSIAINCILAQSIHTCTAKKVQLKPMLVSTCMALRDDVVTGESYYYREAKCLRRMLDFKRDKPVLLIIDEILKGTNTIERIAASKAILDYLGKTGFYVIVATHDNELTENDKYQNYYFSSELNDNQIIFDYQIHEGKCTQSNAITLLEHLNYPKEIVKSAREYICENW